ncbi:hydroxysqualene dehydroxylase HpnE [Limnoglobus roseus]|uniref:FAD-dependent oxidoreductase n=1 Tax=Limnoglobus roseus TaxID=2598579 RepID=A0A5C1ABK7_9BACT|nr:hydroxysqualene dehydroxylase HpnE [Limnoglobus roseus]QEL14408.1 FAD-dependent oxidoreductase [Limnoglobus roseus]
MTSPSILIVGGGLAGLAAATALAPRGYRVTVLESRPRLGGRASSFSDPATGQLVDACQHVSMGCCTNFAHFCRTLGIEHFLEPQRTLWFQTPDRRVSLFRADPWPAPFHLGRALAGAHYLSETDKLRIGWGLLQLRRTSPDADPPLLPWLHAHRQNARTIDRFWGIVLTSALNETVDRVGLKYARKVFVDGFMGHRDGFTVQLPRVPLGRLYGDELRAWLKSHDVEVRENCGVKSLLMGESQSPPVAATGGLSGVTLRDGGTIGGNRVLLTVPFDRVLDLLPPEIAVQPFFARIANLTPSPITSVHLWFDRDLTPLPHVVLVDCLGQWVFNRGGGYVQVVVSASRPLKSQGREKVQEEIVAELRRLYPSDAKLLRAKVVTEHTATFSAVPGVDAFRPPQATPAPNLFLAGDWTQTGWPATMEGAVRSGYLAAEAILAADGRPEALVRPDLA